MEVQREKNIYDYLLVQKEYQKNTFYVTQHTFSYLLYPLRDSIIFMLDVFHFFSVHHCGRYYSPRNCMAH